MFHQRKIDDCHDRMYRAIKDLDNDKKEADKTKFEWEFDHFGFVVSRHDYLKARQEFSRLVLDSDSYAIDSGFVTAGYQARGSKLHWGTQGIDSLVLLGNEVLGMSIGYVAFTVGSLDSAAYELWRHGLDHSWSRLYGQRCVETSLRRAATPVLNGAIAPDYRIYIFEKPLRRLMVGIKPIKF